MTELPAAARISRRIVKAWLGLEKQGWLTTEPAGPRTCAVHALGSHALLSQTLMAFTIDVEYGAGGSSYQTVVAPTQLPPGFGFPLRRALAGA